MHNFEKILENAYIPEHLIHYSKSVTRTKIKLLLDKYLVYEGINNVIIIGYPINGNYCENEILNIIKDYENIYERIILIAEKLPNNINFMNVKYDYYYILELPLSKISKKVRNAIKRASKEISIEIEHKLSRKHKKLIKEFLKFKENEIDEYTKSIYENLNDYVKSSKNVLVLSAYNKHGDLVGFDIIDVSSKNYTFYMFNFITRDKEKYVPGTSDYLMSKIIEITESMGKKYINMGLGICEGVKKFKIKWGAKEFLKYTYGEYIPKKIARFVGLVYESLDRLW